MTRNQKITQRIRRYSKISASMRRLNRMMRKILNKPFGLRMDSYHPTIDTLHHFHPEYCTIGSMGHEFWRAAAPDEISLVHKMKPPSIVIIDDLMEHSADRLIKHAELFKDRPIPLTTC